MQGAGAAPLPAGGPRCACEVAAEQKARATYDNLLRLADDADVKDALRFLRQREIVHYQRFAEALEMVKDGLDKRNWYAFNPNREGQYPLKNQ
ncbi:MAG: manganese catalase family protein [Clostridia bacterium]|nr:manganese catalase family protein [Clostridia bacterium]